jgi:ABC-type nickel/cobalt efflux system permease component RcnA
MSFLLTSLALAGGLTAFLILAVLRQVERSIADSTAARRVANDLAARQAEGEAFRRLQALRVEHAARHHHHHHGHGQHGGGNASMPGGCA